MKAKRKKRKNLEEGLGQHIADHGGGDQRVEATVPEGRGREWGEQQGREEVCFDDENTQKRRRKRRRAHARLAVHQSNVRGLGGQGEGGKSVHDQVDPQQPGEKAGARGGGGLKRKKKKELFSFVSDGDGSWG